jgi:hypothetical protein
LLTVHTNAKHNVAGVAGRAGRKGWRWLNNVVDAFALWNLAFVQLCTRVTIAERTVPVRLDLRCIVRRLDCIFDNAFNLVIDWWCGDELLRCGFLRLNVSNLIGRLVQVQSNALDPIQFGEREREREDSHTNMTV